MSRPIVEALLRHAALSPAVSGVAVSSCALEETDRRVALPLLGAVLESDGQLGPENAAEQLGHQLLGTQWAYLLSGLIHLSPDQPCLSQRTKSLGSLAEKLTCVLISLQACSFHAADGFLA